MLATKMRMGGGTVIKAGSEESIGFLLRNTTNQQFKIIRLDPDTGTLMQKTGWLAAGTRIDCTFVDKFGNFYVVFWEGTTVRLNKYHHTTLDLVYNQQLFTNQNMGVIVTLWYDPSSHVIYGASSLFSLNTINPDTGTIITTVSTGGTYLLTRVFTTATKVWLISDEWDNDTSERYVYLRVFNKSNLTSAGNWWYTGYALSNYSHINPSIMGTDNITFTPIYHHHRYSHSGTTITNTGAYSHGLNVSPYTATSRITTDRYGIAHMIYQDGTNLRYLKRNTGTSTIALSPTTLNLTTTDITLIAGNADSNSFHVDGMAINSKLVVVPMTYASRGVAYAVIDTTTGQKLREVVVAGETTDFFWIPFRIR